MNGAKIPSLQALRAFAALAVVAHHSLRAVTVNADPQLNLPAPTLISSQSLVDIGSVGVDVFFILSGFLMVFISTPYVEKSKTFGDFILQRAIRIWPMYVVATTLYLSLNIVAHLAKGDGLPFDASPVRLLSYVFIPTFNASGLLQPILGVGWTLNYEVMFYLVFTLALAVRGAMLLPLLALILSLVFVLGLLLPGDTAAHVFLANPILFEFLLGAACAKLYLTGHLWRLPAIATLLAGIILLAAFAWLPSESDYRVFYRGIPSLLIFAGVLLLDRSIRWPNWWIFVGDASYSIYLFHIIFVYQIAGRVLSLLTRHGTIGLAAELAALVAFSVSVAIGLIVYLLIEKPLTSHLHKVYRKRKLAQSAV
jgi:peptidoglycan/LPS O-acetylase OafA/YrhL